MAVESAESNITPVVLSFFMFAFSEDSVSANVIDPPGVRALMLLTCNELNLEVDVLLFKGILFQKRFMFASA